MAHMLGIKKENVHAIIGHISRCRETGENVDQELSKFNEYHSKDPNKDLYSIYKEEISKCKIQNRKDVNVLASWIITLPKDIEPGSDEEEVFFNTARDFLQKRYPDTYLGDSIHRDEPKSRPHMHYLLLPKVKEIKAEKIRDPETGKLKKTGRKIETGREKIALNDLITRDDLTRFHDDLSKRMKQILGREIKILTGTTQENGGNMNLNQYRAEMERKDAIKAQGEAKEAIAKAEAREAKAKQKITEAEEEKSYAIIQKAAAAKEEERYNNLIADFHQKNKDFLQKYSIFQKKESELNQRERSIADIEKTTADTMKKAEEAQAAADEKESANTIKAQQLQQEEIKLNQRLKEANDTKAKADAALKTANEKTQKAQSQIEQLQQKENELKELQLALDTEKEKITAAHQAADQKIAEVKKLNNEVVQKKKEASDLLSAAQTKESEIKERENNVKQREIALEESRPDLKAAHLNREIKAIEKEIFLIESMPQSEKDIEMAAYIAINPEIATKQKKLDKITTLINEARENNDIYIIYNDKEYSCGSLERTKNSLTYRIVEQKEEIDNDPSKREQHQQLQKKIKNESAAAQERLPQLKANYEQKCEEYAFYGGAAVDLLIKVAPKWQEIAPEIESICRKHFQVKTAEKEKTPKNRGFER